MNNKTRDPFSLKLPKSLTAEILPTRDSSNRFNSADENNAEQKIRFIDSSSGEVCGYLVVDDTRRGPGVGGIRIAPDLRLEEMSRLAYAMTLKNSAACMPFGGGKSGLVADPCLLANEPQLKSDLIALFAEALFPFENYISAPDMGTHEHDIQQIYDFNSSKLGTTTHMRGGAGRETGQGGIPIDDWALTAHGLVTALKTLEELDSGIRVKDSHIVIQGYGNVGAPVAEKLHSKGALIVGVSDIHAGLWEPSGLDMDQLNIARNTEGGLSRYKGKTEKRFNANQIDWLLEAPCDILVPSARPDAITARNADRIQCKLILQGANAPVNKMTEYYLSNRRGILSLSDFIINSGGIIGCGVEITMTADNDYKKKVQAEGIRQYTENLITKTISRNVSEIYTRLKETDSTDIIFREEGLKLAQERLQNPEEHWL